jgi:hypothetical protein
VQWSSRLWRIVIASSYDCVRHFYNARSATGDFALLCATIALSPWEGFLAQPLSRGRDRGLSSMAKVWFDADEATKKRKAERLACLFEASDGNGSPSGTHP